MQIKEQITSKSNKYDYIIAGAGLAGLSLAYKIRKDKNLNNKRILLIDRDTKKQNDRTWCFWSKEEELFESIVFNSWPNIQFANQDFKKTFNIDPYKYKMIRGIDFYNHVIPFLQSSSNTDFIFSDIVSFQDNPTEVRIETKDDSFSASYVFKSYHEKIDFSKSHFVWQHFKGWIIDSPHDSFNPEVAMFMDFRIEQADETRFFYVLPFSKRKALVEIAIFSESIPQSGFYDPIMDNYIKNELKINEYKIEEEELGAIPMTSYNFNTKPLKRIINIGTNAGSVQASSGYAFKRIQKETDHLKKQISKNRLDDYKPLTNRYSLYDNTLLNAITTGKTSGEKVFGKLFEKLSPQTIFKFMDQEGGFFHDLKIFTAPPRLPFLKAFIEEIKIR